MSYSHCKTCFKTIHTSDLHRTGSSLKDCGVCGYENTAVEVDTDADVSVYVYEQRVEIPDMEFWKEYSSQYTEGENDKVVAYYHSRVLGTSEHHQEIDRCLISDSSFHDCMSQADRKRDAMFNTQDDDI